ncbi:MAG: bifunctional adenosylcobinamide kinase/adenosylcobinamide-phosphate guanylyltransferase [Methylovulum sp.]|uniref:bifunctional adenosylcobinamide kinase/adenosylcobinamide-phosphate guanylyltransferase n=1 Tax=Methylovulum sp. TaxID=1916980 RepID=UPI002637C20F|nr:bifunctional adenosylcobinamide kinase/adenosylcobinamide-phosphate guanylyltransferase [Methylovulum sp.]MDD2725345.1 bifunctional adenosylcobinamide kinase/adenosylcobinamide-phosphate guanylyltransferase [Methylovulum sp.]MDD5126450.1 bifunctional adenosylcobinamide kinase/adenosylcobinamide-phosphate guanylyltransferase [Methylovulum sp.]
MKTLFIGGVKSGKSRLAEAYILQYADIKPYYLATTECLDGEMRLRIAAHQERRQDLFITLEEPVKLLETLQACQGPVLVECVTMWLNNMLYHQHSEAAILQELEAVLQLPGDWVLVHNEVGLGVIPDNHLARQFVDLSGKAAQLMGQYCGKVFFCSAGLMLAMK